MISAIVPQFFTTDLARTLVYYDAKLGFETQFKYGQPPYFAGAIRDQRSIFFRLVDEAPSFAPNKYECELLDAYIIVGDVALLFAEYRQRGVAFHRELAAMPWDFTEFVVKDIDGRLLCFGQFSEDVK